MAYYAHSAENFRRMKHIYFFFVIEFFPYGGNPCLELTLLELSHKNLGSTSPSMQHVCLTEKGDNRWRCWWLALTWSVWQHRNKIIFSNGIFDGNKVLEEAIFTLWTWMKNFEKDFALPYNYWSSNI